MLHEWISRLWQGWKLRCFFVLFCFVLCWWWWWLNLHQYTTGWCQPVSHAPFPGVRIAEPSFQMTPTPFIHVHLLPTNHPFKPSIISKPSRRKVQTKCSKTTTQSELNPPGHLLKYKFPGPGQLEHHSIHWNVVGSIPGQSTSVGWGLGPKSGCVRKATNLCLLVTLMFLFLSLPFSKAMKNVLSGD